LYFKPAIAELVENMKVLPHKQNLFTRERKILSRLSKNKNKNSVLMTTDKHLGLSSTPKIQFLTEAETHLKDLNVYLPLSKEECKVFIERAKEQLRNIINKHGRFLYKELQEFLCKNLDSFTIPHFYFLWKVHKDPKVIRSIVASYNWITTAASIYVSDCLKDHMSKFDTILKDSLTLVRILETTKFPKNCILFTVDFKSLYTNIPIDLALDMFKEFFNKHSGAYQVNCTRAKKGVVR
jgi:hypothetical protein